MFSIDIRRHGAEDIDGYAAIPSRLVVREVVDVASARVGSAAFRTRRVDPVRVKDYDALADADPRSWRERYDTSGWILLAAYAKGIRVGGAIVAAGADAIALGGRDAHALLWDIRVAPGSRRHGVGRALMDAALDAARALGARGIDAETQDVNVPACRLYGDRGFVLHAIQPGAYEDVPDETRLTWTRELARR